MDNFLLYFVSFVAGILVNALWGYMLGLGHSILMMRQTITDCLMVMARNIQAAYEINQLKYMAMDMSGKDKKFIDFQKSLDEKELKSLRNTVIRNFVNSIPPKYNSSVPFSDWDSAMLHLESELNNQRKNNE